MLDGNSEKGRIMSVGVFISFLYKEKWDEANTVGPAIYNGVN